MAIELRDGELIAASDEIKEINALLKRIAQDDDRALHSLFAQRLLGPIITKSAYEEVYNDFFMTQNVGPTEIVRVVLADYISTAWYTAPGGQVAFVRPGRKYATVSWKMVDTGMEFGWDDLAAAGWPMLQHYISQAGEELARKKDAARLTAIDASISGQSGHSVTCYGKMTRSAVDSVLAAASDDKTPITFAIGAPSRLMDMSYWTGPVNSLWRIPEDMGAQIIKNGWVQSYGGIKWIAKRFASTSAIYFGGVPSDNGMWELTMGGIRKASDIDIEQKIDKYTWDMKFGHYIGGGLSLYKITIS